MLDFFAPIGIPFGWIMYAINNVVNNYGLTLILFAILVKVIMIPLGLKQQKALIKNARIQPKMQALQRQYGKDKNRYAEELQKLYDKEKMNPMASCLPALIQMPILIGMLDVIYRPIKHLLRLDPAIIDKAVSITKELSNGAALNQYSQEMNVLTMIKSNPAPFIEGLGAPAAEKIMNLDFTMFGLFLGDMPVLKRPETMTFVVWIALLMIPVLSGISSLLMSKITSASTAGGDESTAGMNKAMMMMMPLMSVWISFIVPAGVGIYWLLSNVLSVIQSLVFNKIMNPAKEAQKAEAEEEAEREKEREERIEQKKKLREDAQRLQAERDEALKNGKKMPRKPAEIDDTEIVLDESALSQKEINRRKLAEARKRDALRYGEEYIDVTDDDVK